MIYSRYQNCFAVILARDEFPIETFLEEIWKCRRVETDSQQTSLILELFKIRIRVISPTF